jgi:RimJ/RimL family protein N-acetyltransferase
MSTMRRRAVSSADGPCTWMTGARVHVRPLADSDIGPHYASWFEDPEIRRFIKFAREAPTVEDLRRYRDAMAARSDVDFLGIFLNGDGRHIGNLKFEAGDRPEEMHVGFLIGDPGWRRVGVLTEILAPCVVTLRTRRTLDRVYLTVDPLNAPGIGAFTKLGFAATGVIDQRGDLEMDYVDRPTT